MSKGLLKTREPLYAQAELTIDTSRHTPEQSVALILRAFAAQPRRAKRPSTPRRSAARTSGQLARSDGG